MYLIVKYKTVATGFYLQMIRYGSMQSSWFRIMIDYKEEIKVKLVWAEQVLRSSNQNHNANENVRNRHLVRLEIIIF